MHYDTYRFPLIKRNGVYYLASEITFQNGWTYTLLMENGDCFSGSGPSKPEGLTGPAGLTGFIGAPNLGDGYLTIHGITEGHFSELSPAPNNNANYTPYEEEYDTEPSSRDRYSSFGINSHQVSFSPFTSSGLTGFVNNGNQFHKTSYSQTNPLVLWTNQNDTDVVDMNSIF
jgi:hypothetical protein